MRHAGEFELLAMLAVLWLGSGAHGFTVREELERETSRTLTLRTVYSQRGFGDGFIDKVTGQRLLNIWDVELSGKVARDWRHVRCQRGHT